MKKSIWTKHQIFKYSQNLTWFASQSHSPHPNLGPVCMCAFGCVFLHVCMHSWLSMCVNTCVCMLLCACVCEVCIMYAWVQARVHLWAWASAYMCVHACTHREASRKLPSECWPYFLLGGKDSGIFLSWYCLDFIPLVHVILWPE